MYLHNFIKSRFYYNQLNKNLVNRINYKDKIKKIIKMNKGSLIHCHYSGIVKGENLIKYLFLKKKISFNNGQLIHTRYVNNNINKEEVLEYFYNNEANFETIGNLFYNIIKNVSFFEDYNYLIIRQMKEQNIDNIQFRIKLGSYFRNKKKISIEEEIKLFYNIQKLYKKFNKKFSIIVQSSRFSNKTYSYFDTILHILENNFNYKSIIKGFDIVGNENKKPLSYHKNDILKLLDRMKKLKIEFFFHAGETEGIYTKSNLEFSLKYGGNRIAHGIQLLKYPLLLNVALKRKTVLEISPLSNVILEKYKPDIFKKLKDSGVLFTINSDDPNKLGDKDLTDNYIYLFKKSGFTFNDFKKSIGLSNIVFNN
jgi:adenosine deaminase